MANLRIRVGDLPSRTGDDVLVELTIRSGKSSRTVALGDGDISIGRGGNCQLRISSAGVAMRHLRLRRDGESLFIQPIGRSKVVVGEHAIDGITPLQYGSDFRFGSVIARVERVSAADRSPAVTIPIARAASHERVDALDLEVQRLDLLGDAWQRTLRGTMTLDAVLEVLRDALGPVSASIRERAGDEWAVLATVRGDDSLTAVESEGDVAVSAYVAPADVPVARRICHQLALIAAHVIQTRRRTRREKAPEKSADAWQELVGSRIRAHLRATEDLCRTANAALVVGETGTGKELVARALHGLWNRSGAFIAINCAAVPADLLDAELFGVEAGIATGVGARQGRFDQAQKGTLFLDEIGDLPMQLQGKLLRVLQEREYFPVGGTKLRRADVKLVAATNNPDARHGLRQDLYFRMAQATLALPPLRERTEDLALLCEHFLTALEAQFGRRVAGISVSALEQLQQHAWPGNVRELQNLLRGAYATATPGSLIRAVDLPIARTRGGTLQQQIEDLERAVIERELARAPNVRAAAEALDLSEGYLYRKVKKLGVKRS
jgi:DNA-binding NtrC family response regulator